MADSPLPGTPLLLADSSLGLMPRKAPGDRSSPSAPILLHKNQEPTYVRQMFAQDHLSGSDEADVEIP
jgi:hypothetical protein